MGALDEEDLYDEFDGLPDPLMWDGDEPPMELLESKNTTVVDGTDRRPLVAAPLASRGPAFSGPGFDQQKTQAPGFDWRRALVAAGKGDVRQYDANKLRREQAPLLEEQRRSARARLDPMSPESKQAQQSFASELRMYSEVPGLPASIRGEIEAMGANVDKLSAAQIERTSANYQRLLGSTLRGVHEQGITDRANKSLEQRKAEAERRARQFAQSMGLQWERLSEQQQMRLLLQARYDTERDDRALDRFGKEVEPLNVNEQVLQDVKAGMGDMQTGWIPDKWNKLKQFVGLGNKQWDTAQGALEGVRNELRHGLFGGALTPQEAEAYMRELPDMSMPRATFDAKLEQVLRKIALKIREAKKRNPRGAALADKQSQPAAAAPAPAPAKVDTISLAKQALADPKAPAAAKAKAKEILDAAGIAY